MWYKVKRIMVWDKQVRPYRYNPWANTIAYYPLTASSTVNDISWNNLNLTNTNVTFGSYKWVDCGYFSWSAKLTATYVNSWIACTILCWAYYIYSWSTAKNQALWRWWSNFWPYVNNMDTKKLVCSPWSIGSNLWTSDSQWKLIAVTYNWSNTLKMYENWTLVGTNSSATVPTWTTFTVWWDSNETYNGRWIWWISNVIVESGVWEQTKIQDYYNKSKSQYWL